MPFQRGFRDVRVVQYFTEQATADIFARVNRHDSRAAIHVLQVVMAALDADNVESKPLQGRNQFATVRLGNRVTTRR
jgi:hypothetical protein